MRKESNMAKQVLFFSVFFLVVGLVSAATPRIVTDSVTAAQDADGALVTVHYRLADADAIITLDIETNATGTVEGPWVSIGDANIGRVVGDANKRVAADEDTVRTITWRPDKSWNGPTLTAENVRAVVKAWELTTPPDYMVIDLSVTNTVRYYTSAAALPEGGLANDMYRLNKLVLRRIPAKGMTFRMGSPSDESGRVANDEILHYVSFTNDYYLAVYTMTEYQYTLLMGQPRPSPDTAFHPSGKSINYRLSWTIVRGNTDWPGTGDWAAARAVGENTVLGRLRAHVGWGLFDLPTDAQWEFACRAGTDTATYDSSVALSELGWYGFSPAEENLYPVGLKKPNPWGLYDMLGNSWEFCLDRYASGSAYSDGSAVTEPVGPATGTDRVVRGGAYSAAWSHLRSAYRARAPQTTVLIRYSVRVCLPVGL